MRRQHNLIAAALDLDGVIIDSSAAHAQAWERALLPYGIAARELDLLLLEGANDAYIAGFVAESSQRALSSRQIGRVCSSKRQAFDRLFDYRLVEGADEFVQMLRMSGMPLALVTGSPLSIVTPILDKLHLDSFFRVVVTADSVSQGKPDPAPYQAALERLGVAPNSCLAVENAPLGIRSAKSAGLLCAAITSSLAREHLWEADIVVQSLAELGSWISSS